MPIARTLRGQTVKGFQHLLTQYGSTDKVMVSVTSMPITNGMGEVIGATAALVEIETETGEGIDDLTGLWRGHWFAAATVPFWGLDEEGRILDINNAALDVFDLKREQAIGRNWAQFFVQDADFQSALDYLGDARDDADPHTPGLDPRQAQDRRGRDQAVAGHRLGGAHPRRRRYRPHRHGPGGGGQRGPGRRDAGDHPRGAGVKP